MRISRWGSAKYVGRHPGGLRAECLPKIQYADNLSQDKGLRSKNGPRSTAGLFDRRTGGQSPSRLQLRKVHRQVAGRRVARPLGYPADRS